MAVAANEERKSYDPCAPAKPVKDYERNASYVYRNTPLPQKTINDNSQFRNRTEAKAPGVGERTLARELERQVEKELDQVIRQLGRL